MMLVTGFTLVAQSDGQTAFAPNGTPRVAGAVPAAGTGVLIRQVAQSLKLTSAQQARFDQALDQYTRDMGEVSADQQRAREAIRAALASGRTEADAEVEQMAASNARAMALDLKLWVQLYVLSTPEQRQQLQKLPTPLTFVMGQGN
jgi:Spy/CpxP family protein refolding chaperone